MGDRNALSPEQEAEILELCSWAEDNNASEGLELDLHQIARSLDWKVTTLNRVKKLIRRHPELGITFLVKRGRYRKVIIAFDQSWITDPALMVEAHGMAVTERKENFERLLNSSSNLITAYGNVRPKTRTEARMVRQERWIIEDLLVNIRSFARRYGLEQLQARVERVLIAAGHTFPPDEDE